MQRNINLLSDHQPYIYAPARGHFGGVEFRCKRFSVYIHARGMYSFESVIETVVYFVYPEGADRVERGGEENCLFRRGQSKRLRLHAVYRNIQRKFYRINLLS